VKFDLPTPYPNIPPRLAVLPQLAIPNPSPENLTGGKFFQIILNFILREFTKYTKNKEHDELIFYFLLRDDTNFRSVKSLDRS
jgi:hypothetical protein